MRRLTPSLIVLVLAWFCANRPQDVLVTLQHVVARAAVAHDQAELAGAVSQLLRGDTPHRASTPPRHIASAPVDDPVPERHAAPERTLGRPEWYLPPATMMIVPRATYCRFGDAPRAGILRVREVPHPPPRARA